MSRSSEEAEWANVPLAGVSCGPAYGGNYAVGFQRAIVNTVTFVIAGFHWPWVYQPGVRLQEVVDNIPPAGPINYEVVSNGVSNVFAKGVYPGTPAAGFLDADGFPLSATQNRADTIAFSTPGRDLDIHLLARTNQSNLSPAKRAVLFLLSALRLSEVTQQPERTDTRVAAINQHGDT